MRKLTAGKCTKARRKYLGVLKMRCSFHITHLKGYNYHKHFNSIKDHWRKLALISAKGSHTSRRLEESNTSREESLILVKQTLDYVELHRFFFLDLFCTRHYGTLTNFHLSTVIVAVRCFNLQHPNTQKHSRKETLKWHFG